MKRVRAAAVPVCVSLLLVLLSIAGEMAVRDVELTKDWQVHIQVENYFSEFFGGPPTVFVSLGLLIFWLLGRNADQLAHRARAYLLVSLGLVALEALLVFVGWSLDLDHLDCRDHCVWYVLPNGVATSIRSASVGVQLVVVLGVHWWMRRWVVK